MTESCSDKCEYFNDEPILSNMYTKNDTECDLWDEDGYCRHCEEITYQCSECNVDFECTHCEVTIDDEVTESVLVFSPYKNPDEMLSCLIPECV